MRVELVDHMGTDLSVVNAARVSFSKSSDWDYEELDSKLMTNFDGTPVKVMARKIKDRDAKLINYLAREKHVLPFRHPQITVRCKAPIFLARQLGKHQVGLSWSEESRRYIDSQPEFFWPDKWRKRAENIKQGSSDEVVETMRGLEMHPDYERDRRTVQEVMEAALEVVRDAYENALDAGVAPELARMILPQNMYVNWVWTGSLLSFYQMYKLRAEAHAQKEAQDFAGAIKDVIAPLYPVSWTALEAYA